MNKEKTIEEQVEMLQNEQETLAEHIIDGKRYLEMDAEAIRKALQERDRIARKQEREIDMVSLVVARMPLNMQKRFMKELKKVKSLVQPEQDHEQQQTHKMRL